MRIHGTGLEAIRPQHGQRKAARAAAEAGRAHEGVRSEKLARAERKAARELAKVERKAARELAKAERRGADRSPVEARSSTEPAPDATASEEALRAERGVIGLLRAGHFRGVADVRLRIRFQAELQAAAAPAPEAVAERVEAVVDNVATELDAADVDPEARTALDLLGAEFRSAAADAQTADGSLAALSDGLRGAFDALLEGLGDAVPAGTLDALRAGFETSLAELPALEPSGDGLPPLSEPNGNGVAYAKFVAVYLELQAAGGAVADEPGPDEVAAPDAEPAPVGTEPEETAPPISLVA